MERKSWIKVVRPYDLEPTNSQGTYKKKLFITNKYEKIDHVPRVSLPPLPHQKVTVKAMIDIEEVQYCTVDLAVDNPPGDKVIAETRAAVLSEHPGSGKTIEILMLIAHKKIPNKKSEITTVPMPRSRDIIRNRFETREKYGNNGFMTEFRKTYNKIYPQTFIFVGKSVLGQWMEAIQEFTDFKVFMIDNIFALREFHSMCFGKNKSKLSEYEIILIKNGNISGKFDVPELVGTPLEHTKSKAILSVFGELFKNVCIARVVLDDFDYLNIPTTAKVIPALFTWLVSATKKIPPAKRNIDHYHSITEYLESYRPSYTSIWNNRELFTFFNLGCKDSFIDKSTRASKVRFYVYIFHNPNDNYISLLGAMDTSETNAVMEMLNGDAINEAAEATGIKTNSVADIFEKILDNKWEIYKRAISILKYASGVRNIIDNLPALSDPKKSISTANMDAFKKNLKKPGPISHVKKSIKYKQTSISAAIVDVEEEYASIKEKNGLAIQRVKDNLKQGDCPITCEPLSEVQSIVIMKCCGVVISSEVMSWTLKMKTTSASDVRGMCPNCRADISIRDLIFVDKDKVDFEDISDENAVEIEEEEEEKEEEKEKEPEDEPEEMNKYNCIINIIKGVHIQEKEMRNDISIPNLLIGDEDKGEAPPESTKVLIFANFKETMQLIEKKLIKNLIPYLKIQGTPNQIKDAVSRYNLPNEDEESINVLLINGPRLVAGLNLQATTDLIFAAKVMDPNVESQIGGRICRIGRSYNARIHYVLYKNEYAYMFGSGNKRPWEM